VPVPPAHPVPILHQPAGDRDDGRGRPALRPDRRGGEPRPGDGRGGPVTIPVRPETDRRIDELLTRFPMRGSALLPALYLVQEEKGHVSDESMEYVASKIGVSPAFVAGVVSFYTMFHRQPVGRRHIQVCRTLPCALSGADDL